MKRFSVSDPYPATPTVLTIGTFDGVHLGHRKIIDRLISIAANHKLTPTVLTFFPHPRMVLQPDVEIKLLNTIEERFEILKDLGVECLVVKEFNKEFASYTPENYVREVILEELKAKYVVIGYDHHFGRRRSAGIKELKEFGASLQFEVEEISAKDIDDVAISSTKIRKALDSGEVRMANSYLGYPYRLNATVVKGRGIGKTIGFPTANLQLKASYKLIPRQGVYAVRATHRGTAYHGMMNIGQNPTVGGNQQSLEVHLFNFSDNLYGEDLRIEFLDRLRNEIKFDSVEELKQQLTQDKADAQRVLYDEPQ